MVNYYSNNIHNHGGCKIGHNKKDQKEPVFSV